MDDNVQISISRRGSLSPGGVAHQVQLGPILAAHYAGARQSIEEWIKRRDQYIALYMMAVTAIVGFSLNKPGDDKGALLVVPFLSAVVLCAYLSADLHVGFVAKWLKVEYTAMLNDYVGTYGIPSLGRWHWDNSETLDEFYNRGSAKWRYIFLGVLFVISNVFAPAVLVLQNFESQEPALILGAIVAGGCCLALRLAYRRRKGMATLQADPSAPLNA